MSSERADPAPSLPLPVIAVETEGFCYGPLADRVDPAELTSADGPQRWSDAGAPTAYFASDVGVALAEWGRHVPVGEDREPTGLWRVPVRLDRAVDLRGADPGAIEALGRLAGVEPCPDGGDPAWCLVADDTRDLGAWLRYEARLDGLIVPSVAFLDDRGRGNLVVFLEDEASARGRLGEPTLVAAVRWADRSPAVAHLDTRVQVPASPVFGRL